MEVFRFVDSVGAVRLDLLDENGWMLHRGFDLGTSTLEKAYLGQPPYDGAVLAATYRGVVTMQVPLVLMPQSTRAAMKTKMEALRTELNRPKNYLEFRPTGYNAEGLGSYIAYTYKSDIPTLLRATAHPSSFFAKRGVSPIVVNIDREPELGGLGVAI